jgi:hypothetical protein
MHMIPIAYIDPSSGSLVFQVIIGTIVRGLVTINLWWGRAIDKLTGLFGRRREDG